MLSDQAQVFALGGRQGRWYHKFMNFLGAAIEMPETIAARVTKLLGRKRITHTKSVSKYRL